MNRSPTMRIAALGLALLGLASCNALTRLSQVGDAPRLTNIQNPTQNPQYRPVTMPMPAPEVAEHQANSLWRPGARGFFKDQRAHRVGDILTVSVAIKDKAGISNATKRSRANSEDLAATSLLGYEQRLNKFLPQAVNPASLVDLNSNLSNQGAGSVERDEEINVKVAAVITQVLPNGNLVIQGRQEVRVNFERRDLEIAGVIRPEDISSSNQITADKIAEARIAYGGQGQITDMQQPRYGSQVLDVILPF
jgi:flagellar L-ring protein FlgH